MWRACGRVVNHGGSFSPKFGAASPRDFKIAKGPGKTIGSKHVLMERRKRKVFNPFYENYAKV